MREPGHLANQLLLLDFSPDDHGHRGQYNAMIAALFNTRRIRFGWESLYARAPVLVPGIEAAPVRYALLCLIRAVLGRRTAAFLLRPLPVVQAQSIRLRLKGAALRLLKRLPGNTILTIVPFAIEPGLAHFANDWIYDLQNWDRQLPAAQVLPTGGAPTARLDLQIAAVAAGRMVCCAVGRQDDSKGFRQFAQLYCRDAALRNRVLFAYGGSVSPPLKSSASQFAGAGGFGCDRFISDEELIELYRAADLIWCVYAPDYDQASGILGRAMQLGLPVIARRGSVIERICQLEKHPYLSFDPATEQVDHSQFPPRLDAHEADVRAARHAQHSLAKLSHILGLKPLLGSNAAA